MREVGCERLTADVRARTGVFERLEALLLEECPALVRPRKLFHVQHAVVETDPVDGRRRGRRGRRGARGAARQGQHGALDVQRAVRDLVVHGSGPVVGVCGDGFLLQCDLHEPPGSFRSPLAEGRVDALPAERQLVVEDGARASVGVPVAGDHKGVLAERVRSQPVAPCVFDGEPDRNGEAVVLVVGAEVRVLGDGPPALELCQVDRKGVRRRLPEVLVAKHVGAGAEPVGDAPQLSLLQGHCDYLLVSGLPGDAARDVLDGQVLLRVGQHGRDVDNHIQVGACLRQMLDDRGEPRVDLGVRVVRVVRVVGNRGSYGLGGARGLATGVEPPVLFGGRVCVCHLAGWLDVVDMGRGVERREGCLGGRHFVQRNGTRSKFARWGGRKQA